MFQFKRRRSLIRMLSFTIAGFVISVTLAITGLWMAYAYRMNIEYSYQRALNELSEHVDNIDLSLQKGIYASTSAQLVGLSSEILSESNAAKSDLAQMPLSSVNLSSTNKFISQVGDYTNALSKQIASNNQITDADRTNLKNLSNYAKQLSSSLSDTMSDLQSGRLHLFKSENAIKRSNQQKNEAQQTVENNFANIETGFSNVPSLIYDGPFSDNVDKKLPAFIQGKAQVSRDQAKKNAADFLGVNISVLNDNGETAGNLPTYNFTDSSISISITKAGGYTVRMLNSKSPAASKMDSNAALAKANDFLKNRGINNMKETYSLANNNICTFNFAYVSNGVTCYPDLIKVGVSLDTGEILSFDATNYIMNHTKRSFNSSKVSEASIRSILNPLLKVQKTSVALIPTSGGGEALCYEYICTGQDNQQIIDYFNTQTGAEQQLLILISTPGGTLTM